MNAYTFTFTNGETFHGMNKVVVVHRDEKLARRELLGHWDAYTRNTVALKAKPYCCPDCGATGPFQDNGCSLASIDYSVLCTACGYSNDPNA